MTDHSYTSIPPLHLCLPATSANLGPGFDALGLAMGLYLTIDARVAASFHIHATGRNPELCGQLEHNLLLTTYIDVLAQAGHLSPRLHLQLHNEIPLGMGCGSSAAALLAGVLLANHFGKLNWNEERILEEACRREGHPDNVAACYFGGMTASKVTEEGVITATFGRHLHWGLLLVVPSVSLATEKARALLPSHYSRADAVSNIQSTALLVAAFAHSRPDLLRTAMLDKIHQPYRAHACHLLPVLLPLARTEGVYGVALSGAGPSVLLLTDPAAVSALSDRIRQTVADPTIEIIQTTISEGLKQSTLAS